MTRFFRSLAYLYIGVGLAAISLGTWAGAGLALCGGVVWALNRKETA